MTDEAERIAARLDARVAEIYERHSKELETFFTERMRVVGIIDRMATQGPTSDVAAVLAHMLASLIELERRPVPHR